MATPSAKRLPHGFFDDALPFKMDGVYCKLVPLTQGQYAIVWLSDYDSLAKHAWCAVWNACTRSFYATRAKKMHRSRKNIHIAMHREILGLGRTDKRQGDHAFSVTLDNRRFVGTLPNLRIASQGQNKCNKRKYQNNRTGFKGVRRTASGNFEARIRSHGILRSLGTRDTAEAAHRELYVPAALRLHGEFARIA